MDSFLASLQNGINTAIAQGKSEVIFRYYENDLQPVFDCALGCLELGYPSSITMVFHVEDVQLQRSVRRYVFGVQVLVRNKVV